MRCLIRVAAFLLLVAVFAIISGCQANFSPKYRIGYAAPEKDPAYLEKVLFDQVPVGPGGIVTCCWEQAQSVIVPNPSPPLPREISIRWFNYRQQKFYEASVHLPEDVGKIMRSLKPWDNLPVVYYLTTGVLPHGEVVVWVSNGLSEYSGTWVEVARGKGKQVPGNPNDYKTQTEGMRRRGEI